MAGPQGTTALFRAKMKHKQSIKYMPDELIDIFDEHNHPLGGPKMKSVAHRDGLWHRAVHILVCNEKGEFLLQLRSKYKKLYPNLWDVSVAGHIGAGEEPVISAIRELEEEVGLKADPSDLEFCGTRHSGAIYQDIINNEFFYIYFFKFNGDVHDLKLQIEEVDEVKFVSIKHLEDSLAMTPLKFVNHGDYWREVIEIIKSKTT